MEILEAYELTDSYRAAAELAGCDHHTVARYVLLRAVEEAPKTRAHQVRPIEPFRPKIEELMACSRGRIRADRAHQRLVAMGFGGGERTTRRAVAEAKGGVPGRAAAGAPAMDPRAGAVAALGPGHRPTGGRPGGSAVVRLAGLVSNPGAGGVAGVSLNRAAARVGGLAPAARTLLRPRYEPPRRSCTWEQYGNSRRGT